MFRGSGLSCMSKNRQKMIQQKKSDKEWKILLFFFSFSHLRCVRLGVVKCISPLAVNIYELS